MATKEHCELLRSRIDGLRVLLDHTNLMLRDVLQQRARLVRKVGQIKAQTGIKALDSARERSMVLAFRKGAGAGFDGPALERIFKAVLRESRALVLQARRR